MITANIDPTQGGLWPAEPTMSPALRTFLDAGAALVAEGVVPAALSEGDKPLGQVLGLMQSRCLIDYQLAVQTAVSEAGGALPFRGQGAIQKTSNWDPSFANALSRSGKLLLRRDDLGALMVAGVITLEHVDSASRALARLDQSQTDSVLDILTETGIWGHTTPKAVYHLCKRAIRLLDPPDEKAELDAELARYQREYLNIAEHGDGMWALSGQFDSENGNRIKTVLEQLSEKQRVADDGKTRGQRYAAALVTALGEDAPPTAAVNIVIDATAQESTDDLVIDLRDEPEPVSESTQEPELDLATWATYLNGAPITGPNLRFLACDPVIIPLEAEPLPSPKRPGALGILEQLARTAKQSRKILNVGTVHRLATSNQRKALQARDRGCVIPGCEIPATNCQIHHIVPWAQGGGTDLDNLVLLCWSHHREVDLGHWGFQLAEVKRARSLSCSAAARPSPVVK